MAKAAVADEDLLSPLDGGGVGNRAADEHIAARTRKRGGRGLGGSEAAVNRHKATSVFMPRDILSLSAAGVHDRAAAPDTH
jgi:hypothetical protein